MIEMRMKYILHNNNNLHDLHLKAGAKIIGFMTSKDVREKKKIHQIIACFQCFIFKGQFRKAMTL